MIRVTIGGRGLSFSVESFLLGLPQREISNSASFKAGALVAVTRGSVLGEGPTLAMTRQIPMIKHNRKTIPKTLITEVDSFTAGKRVSLPATNVAWPHFVQNLLPVANALPHAEQ